MKFVMTGHKGLIGHFLLERLIACGDKPVLLIDTRDGHDIRDISKHTLKEKADVMIHLAAFCKIDKIIQNPELAFDANVHGTHEVMEFCKRNGIRKIVFTSSSRVLSKEKNPYTASKLYGEELVKGYYDAYGIEYVIIRPSTVYGPFDDKTGRLIDVFIRKALSGEELQIFGDTSKTLDFTYIDDFIDGFLLAMKERNAEFNIANGKGISVSHVADVVLGLAGGGRKAFYPAQCAQPQHVEVDISALEKIGYVPKVSVEQGVRLTFDFYKKNLILQKASVFVPKENCLNNG
jgi:UDP-glucose 4-epimerase